MARRCAACACLLPHYHVVVAAVTFLVLMIGAGVRAAPGLLTVQLEAATGWDRGVIGSVVADRWFVRRRSTVVGLFHGPECTSSRKEVRALARAAKAARFRARRPLRLSGGARRDPRKRALASRSVDLS